MFWIRLHFGTWIDKEMELHQKIYLMVFLFLFSLIFYLGEMPYVSAVFPSIVILYLFFKKNKISKKEIHKYLDNRWIKIIYSKNDSIFSFLIYNRYFDHFESFIYDPSRSSTFLSVYDIDYFLTFKLRPALKKEIEKYDLEFKLIKGYLKAGSLWHSG